jgi:hypothetical protein
MADHISTWSVVSGVVGVVGLGVAVVREVIAGRERRRVRPVVVCHEARKRTVRDGRDVADVYLTNESGASAFNVRFGIEMHGVYVPWKHDQSDAEASRLNVLRPGQREPEDGVREILIPDRILWALGADVDPDDGRSYWAYYQSPAGDWWLTSNPSGRSADLTIKRIRRRRFGTLSRQKRALERHLREGAEVQREAVRELREGAEQAPAGNRNDS